MTNQPNQPFQSYSKPTQRTSRAAKTSGLAIASLVLGITAIIPTCIGAIVGLILGIVALVQINGSKGQLTGKGMAITGIVLSALFGSLIPVAVVLPAIQQVRAAARRVSDTNSMQSIVVATHNYESAFRQLPPSNGHAKRGKGLSWRVHLLPFLEQQPLYNRFDFDKPWDSEPNLSLLAEMPDCFKSNGSLGEVPDGHTLILRPSGNGAIDPGDGRRQQLATIKDGVANTIMLVEVNPSEAVPWTKPDDYHFDPSQPLRGIGNNRAGKVFLVAFADGSTSPVSNNIDAKTFAAMITAQGGEIVDWRPSR